MRRLLFVSIAAALGLLALEGAARAGMAAVLRWTVPSPEVRDYIEHNRVVYDPELGWRPMALDGAVDTMWLGLGAARLEAEPPEGRVRVFAFGDSQTQGGGVRPEESWPALTEVELRARGMDVEVLNAAFSGYRSAQVLALLETRVLGWSPDILVVDCRVGDSAKRAAAPPPNPLAPLLFQSRLYRVLWLGVARARGQDLGLPDPTKPQQALGADAEGPGNHAEIAALARQWGIGLVFVDYPNRSQARSRIDAGAPAEALPPGFPVVRATDALNASGRAPDALFFDINHLTVEGNQIVARAVADTLAPLVEAR